MLENEETLPEPDHPLLLLPGICGTQLGVRDKGADSVEDVASRVWVCIANADREYKKLWGRVNSKEHLELLDEDQEVVVPKKDPTNKSDTGEDGGLYPIDVLDPSLYVPLHVVYYYHNLIWYLKKHNYEPAKTLFGFGFDFRQSNMKHLDELIARLEAASAANNGVKVDVVSHSMGGLVMRSLLALRPNDYSRLVRKWIAIACPFGGAPGFGMDALMTGVEFVQGWEQYFFVGKGTMHAMCCQAPAVYELLPDPLRNNIWPPERGPPKCTVFHQTQAPPTCADTLASGSRKSLTASGHQRDQEHDDDEPVEIVWPQGSGMQAEGQSPDGTGVKEQDYSISEFRNILGEALKGYTVTTHDDKQEVLAMDPICWDISDRARTAWRKTAVPRGSQFFNIFGTGFETAYDVEYGSLEAPIVDPSDITNGDPVRRFTWIDGDSTVPLCCAVSDGLEAVERKGFFATHRGLLELPQVWETVLNFVDVPVEDDDAGTAESSAETFPMSHIINTAASTELFAKVAGGAAGAAGQNPARARRHAQLRAEAHARSKAHSQAWMNSAKAIDRRQGDLHGGVTRHSVGGGWVLVNKKDVPQSSGAAGGSHRGQGPRVSKRSSTEETINPLREHMETMHGSS